MNRIAFFALGFLLLSPATHSQNASPESPTMQALLAEVHQLRQDLQTSAIAARKAQIVIYRLHVQEAIVERTAGRLENAKSAVEQVQTQKKYEELENKNYEAMKDGFNDEQRKQFEAARARYRAQMEALDSQEQDARTRELELEQEFGIEQAKMARLEDELDRLDKAVENFALQASNHQR